MPTGKGFLFPPARLLVLFGLWLMAFLGAMGQHPAHFQVSFDLGLASNSVYRMHQNRAGYMFFATSNGLSRFDGNSFQNYSFEDGLTSNDVLSIYEDSRGRIWVLPYLKTICFLQDGILHNPTTDPWLDKLQARNFFTSIVEDRAHNIWLGDDGGKFFKLDTENRVTQVYELGPRNIRNFAALFLNAAGEPLIATDHLLYNLQRGVLLDSLGSIPDHWSPPLSVHLGGDAYLVVIGEYFLLVEDGQMHSFSPPWDGWRLKAMHAYLDRQRGLWLCTTDGVYRLSNISVEGGKLSFGDTLHLLPGKSVTAAYEDNEGNFWLSTMSEGVYFLPSIDSKTYDGMPVASTPFANKVFRDRRGRVWVGFDGEVVGRLENGAWHLERLPVRADSRGRTNDIYEDWQGNVFVVTDECILITRASGAPLVVDRGGKSVAQHVDGMYYLSHSWSVDTLGRIAPPEFQKEFWKRINSAGDELFTKRCPSLAVGPDGSVYLGTLQGVHVLKDGALQLLEAAPVHPISKVAVAPNGLLWIATTVDGAGYMQNGQFHSVSRREGLLSNICNDIGFAADGSVWLATNGGISRVEIQGTDGKIAVRNFTRGAGLASEEVRSVAVADDYVYAATARGLTVLRLHALIADPPRVNMRIEQLSANGRTVSPSGDRYVLNHTDNQLSVRFTGISFRNVDKLHFEFQLNANDQVGNWSSISGRQLEFPGLRPGRYQLRIRGTVEGHVESMGEASLAWEILPAFWQTGWFLALEILLGCLLVFGVFWLVLRRQRLQAHRRSEVQRRIAETEQKALRSQMNPHFIFNSLNSIEQYFLTDRPQAANAFIADFSDLMRTILDHSALPAISLSEELRFLKLFLSVEQQRMDHRFSYTIDIDAAIQAEEVMVPPMILQPFAENAIWHGLSQLTDRPGRVRIEVIPAKAGVLLVLEDNGIGRTRSEELKSRFRPKHKSSGIRITQERLELLNIDRPAHQRFSLSIDDVLDDEGAVMGTRVTFHIPITFTGETQ